VVPQAEPYTTTVVDVRYGDGTTSNLPQYRVEFEKDPAGIGDGPWCCALPLINQGPGIALLVEATAKVKEEHKVSGSLTRSTLPKGEIAFACFQWKASPEVDTALEEVRKAGDGLTVTVRYGDVTGDQNESLQLTVTGTADRNHWFAALGGRG
jgi:hypothetical protein